MNIIYSSTVILIYLALYLLYSNINNSSSFSNNIQCIVQYDARNTNLVTRKEVYVSFVIDMNKTEMYTNYLY